jgi:hypothetical protein
VPHDQQGASRRNGAGSRPHVSPKRLTPPEVLPVHEGHDWLYVLDGRLRLLLGEEDLAIEPGEASNSPLGRRTGSVPSTASSS